MAEKHIQATTQTMWRVALVLLFLPPAFFISFFIPQYSKSWILAMGIWLTLFLSFYLFYIPTYFKRLRFFVEKDRILFHSGVFYIRIRTVPLSSIQFAFTAQNIFARFFGLATLVVVAAGGRLRVPGLLLCDARKLASLLPHTKEI